MQLSNRQWVILWIVVVSGVILSIVLTPAPEEEELAAEGGHVELQVSADYSNGVLTIRNEGSVDWTEVVLELNPPSDYAYEPTFVRAGETITVAARDFETDDGERLDPSVERPQTLTIDAETEQGTGLWTGNL